MTEKSIKPKQGFQLNFRICFPNPNFTGCFSLFLVLPGALATHMVQLIPGIQFTLGSNQKNSNMKIDPLSFIQYLHRVPPPVTGLVPAIISPVSDSFYKISSEALVVLQLLVKVLRPH